MIPIYTIIIFFAIGMQAFFTATEMALTSVSRIRLRSLVDSGDHRALKLNEFLHKEGAYLGTTLIGTNIAVVVASALATRIFAEYFSPQITPVLATICMVPITLVCAEIIPKIIARQFATDIALFTINPLMAFHGLFLPLIVVINFVAKTLLGPLGRQKTSWDVTLTKSDLKNMILAGHETGGVEADEVELIHNVLEFGGKEIESIMVPLYRVSSISLDDNAENLKRLIDLTGFSRVPIYDGNKDNIVGIVNIYDILFTKEVVPNDTKVSGFVRPIVTINRNDGLDIALTRLRYNEQPMGVVVDNEGTVLGIVTIEDILEEIVGEI